MMPLDTFSSQLGATVGFDDTQQAITISMGGQMVSCVPYSNTAWVNGNVVALDSPVVIVDNVTYIPLQFMCSTFNLNCSWGNNYQQVVIVNMFTGRPLTFYRNNGWGNHRHVWNYNYSGVCLSQFPLRARLSSLSWARIRTILPARADARLRAISRPWTNTRV